MSTTPTARLSTTSLLISRPEAVWLAVAILVGTVLRLGNLQHVAVEHFDEAVYASNLFFPPEQGGEYPFRQLYAPPLLPAAIEWLTIFGQLMLGEVPSWWPMLPALLCGIGTIPSMWWIARQWFSPRAGIIAALLIACNEFHAAYCRTALTDIPLTFFVLWAVHWFWIALQTGRTRDAVIAGVVTSLAWWTKYNGWLPLAIVGSGGVLWQMMTPRAERDWPRLVRIWSIGAATAFVLWLPVLWDCQKIGGYAAVAANHRRYVEGFTKWRANFWRGMANLDEFTSRYSACAMLLILLIAWWIALLNRSTNSKPNSAKGLACSMVVCWCYGLLVATPCYFPFSRLWMPWIVSALVNISEPIVLPIRPEIAVRLQRQGHILLFSGSLFTLLLVVGFDLIGTDLPRPAACIEPRDRVRIAANEIRAKIADPRAAVFVHSEPAIWYHLRQSGQPAVIADGLIFLNQPLPQAAFLVVGPQAERDAAFQEDMKKFESRLELVGEFSFQPSRIVLLDHFSPSELTEHPDRRTMTLRLYRVRR